MTCSGESRFVELSDYLEEVVEVGLDEDGLGAFGGNGCERRVVDAARFDGAVFGEVVDNQIDEGDLVGAVALVVEELVECSLRDSADR